MKRILTLLILFLLFFAISCTGELTAKSGIVRLYRSNEALFSDCAASGDFKSLEKLHGVRDVTVRHSGNDLEVDIYCGGKGLVPSSSYYGILYSPDWEIADYPETYPLNWSKEGEGYRMKERGGDNSFYYEPLGNDYYYYEEHY